MSGFGVGGDARSIPSYTTTSPLDTGTTFPLASTQSHMTFPVNAGEVLESRLSLRPDTLLIQPSILSRVVSAVDAPVPTPIFPPLP